MTHIKRINEMYSQQPTASEVYGFFSDLIKGEFNVSVKKDDNGGRPFGFILFRKTNDKIVELTYDKKTDNIYNIIMYNDTTNASRRYAETIKDIDSKTSDEIAMEIYNYLLSIPQE